MYVAASVGIVRMIGLLKKFEVACTGTVSTIPTAVEGDVIGLSIPISYVSYCRERNHGSQIRDCGQEYETVHAVKCRR